METKEDITQSVVEAYEDTPFKEWMESMQILRDQSELWERYPDEDATIEGIVERVNIEDSKWLTSISLGVLVCFCFSVGILPNFSNIL